MRYNSDTAIGICDTGYSITLAFYPITNAFFLNALSVSYAWRQKGNHIRAEFCGWQICLFDLNKNIISNFVPISEVELGNFLRSGAVFLWLCNSRLIFETLLNSALPS